MNQWYSIINQIICNLVKISNIWLSYRNNWTLDLLIYQPKAVLHYLIVILLDLSYFMQNFEKVVYGKFSVILCMLIRGQFQRQFQIQFTLPSFSSLTTSHLSLLTFVITISYPYDYLTLFLYPSTWKWKQIKLTRTFSYPWYLY